jgi:hypothetical protein
LSELAVDAGIGTCLAVFKAFLTVADFHLLACDIGFTIGMIFALHGFGLTINLIFFWGDKIEN